MAELLDALLTGTPLQAGTAAALAPHAPRSPEFAAFAYIAKASAMQHYSQQAHQAEHPQAWADLTPFQQRCVLHAMERFGGAFISRLAWAWQCADEANSAILGAAFAHRLGSYWPGTVLHAEAARRELA